MGTYAFPPDWEETDAERDDTTTKLGELLAGRFEHVDVDSVAVVREQRERG